MSFVYLFFWYLKKRNEDLTKRIKPTKLYGFEKYCELNKLNLFNDKIVRSHTPSFTQS